MQKRDPEVFCYAIANADGTYHDGSLTDNICTCEDSDPLEEECWQINEGWMGSEEPRDPRLPLRVVALRLA